jgi:hypothetical protein
VVGRLIADWPSCALIGSYELLMRQVRHTAVKERESVSRLPLAPDYGLWSRPYLGRVFRCGGPGTR